MQSAKTFASSTSIHGWNKVADQSKKRAWRLVWTCLTIIMTGLLVMTLVQSTMKYRAYPSSSQIYREYQRSAVFPAVTICNTEIMPLSQIDPGSLAAKFLHGDFGPDTIQWANETEAYQFLVQHKTPYEQFITKCWYGQRLDQCPQYKLTLTTTLGLCYTLFADTEYNVTQPGPHGGVSLEIDIQQYLYSELSLTTGITGAGIIVMVHQASAGPRESDALFVGPGTHTQLALSETMNVLLGEPYSAVCNESTHYERIDCEVKCNNDYFIRLCGCDFLGISDERKCSFLQVVNCLFPSLSAALEAVHAGDSCSCPPACIETNYLTQLSSMAYPAEVFAGVLKTQTGKDLEYAKKNLIRLSLYLKSLNVEVTEQQAAYQLSDFVADVGGQMGVFIGASFLSVAELVEWLLEMLIEATTRRLRSLSTNTKSIHVLPV